MGSIIHNKTVMSFIVLFGVLVTYGVIAGPTVITENEVNTTRFAGDGTDLTNTSAYVTVCASGCDYTTDGTADEVQINAAMDSIPDGGTVYIKQGNYFLNSPIIIQRDSVNIIGTGVGTNLTTNHVSAFQSAGTNPDLDITIRGFYINATHDGHAFNLTCFNRGRIEDVYIAEADTGILLLSDWYGVAAGSWNNVIDHVTIYNSRVGINITGGAARGNSNYIYNTRIDTPSEYGIWINKATGVLIVGGDIETAGKDGVKFEDADNCWIGGAIWMEGNTDSHINISSDASRTHIIAPMFSGTAPPPAKWIDAGVDTVIVESSGSKIPKLRGNIMGNAQNITDLMYLNASSMGVTAGNITVSSGYFGKLDSLTSATAGKVIGINANLSINGGGYIDFTANTTLYCKAGVYRQFRDSSDDKLKYCENGALRDLY